MLQRLCLSLLLLGALPAHAQPEAVTPCVADNISSVPPRFAIDYESQVQTLFIQRCTPCHTGGGTSGGLNLNPGVSYSNIYDNLANNTLPQLDLVEPGDPERSFLYKKINCTNLNSVPQTPYGLRMPRNGPPYLSINEQALLHDWIAAGAEQTPDRLGFAGFETRY